MKKYYYRAKLFNTQIVRVYCASFHEAIILVKNIAIESGWNDEIVDIQDWYGHEIRNIKVKFDYKLS